MSLVYTEASFLYLQVTVVSSEQVTSARGGGMEFCRVRAEKKALPMIIIIIMIITQYKCCGSMHLHYLAAGGQKRQKNLSQLLNPSHASGMT